MNKSHKKRTTLKIDKLLLKKEVGCLYFGKLSFSFVAVSGSKYST